jgi:hypothetical protein
MHRCLRLKSEVHLDLFHEFVGTVFGLPVLGSDICDPSLNKSASSFDHVANTISLSDDKEPPTAAAYRVLDSMSKLPSGEDFDRPKFRVSFLVYLLRILTDDDSPDICESTNFWPTLASGRDLGTFNWASFFLECVINTCAAVRRVVRSKKEPYVPAGVALFLKVMLIIIASEREHILVCIRYSACIFFTNMDFKLVVFQIFYLDNMEYGADSPCPLIRPRVTVYTGSLISKLIMADTVGLRGSVPCRVFGGGKVLFPSLEHQSKMF